MMLLGIFSLLLLEFTPSIAQTSQTIIHGKYTLHISGNDAGFSA
jgi:hypothetical protein